MGLLSSIGNALSKVVRPDKWFDSDTIVGKYLNATKYANPFYYSDQLGSSVTGLSDSERYLTGAAALGGLAAAGFPAAGAAGAAGSAPEKVGDFDYKAYYLKKKKNEKLLPFLGTALTAGSGLGSAALAYAGQQKTNEQNIALSKYLAEYNNAAQMAMWNAQFDKMTEYSSPAAQMARYMAAGINPYAAVDNIGSGEMPSSVGAVPANTPLLRSSGAAAAPFLSDTVAKSAQTYAVLGAADMALTDFNLDYRNKALARQINQKMLLADNEALDGQVMEMLTNAKKNSIAGNFEESKRLCAIAAARASKEVLVNEIRTIMDTMELSQVQASSALKQGQRYYDTLLNTYFQAQIATNEYTATEVKKDVNASLHGILEDINKNVENETIKNILTVLVAGLASRLSAGSLPVPSMSFPSINNTYNNQNKIYK